jgi:hypothetical protein
VQEEDGTKKSVWLSSKSLRAKIIGPLPGEKMEFGLQREVTLGDFENAYAKVGGYVSITFTGQGTTESGLKVNRYNVAVSAPKYGFLRPNTLEEEERLQALADDIPF